MTQDFSICAGRPAPVGATFDGDGVNFAVFSEHASRMTLCLFSEDGKKEIARLDLPERDGDVWHGYIPGLRPGQLYGYRAHGPYRPDEGHRFNPNKLLIDPYAKRLTGHPEWSDALMGYESSRKRMSLLVRLPPRLLEQLGGGPAVRMYCKGADSVVLERLDRGDALSSPEVCRKMEELLYTWAEVALRTLVWAQRGIPEADFAAWHARYRAASESPQEVARFKAGEPNQISALQEEAERGLQLQGATAIEDKLQDGVPEVLADLRSAGVKVWMLTGDKVGTAKNIATACNILPATADTLELTTETHPVLGALRVAGAVPVLA